MRCMAKLLAYDDAMIQCIRIILYPPRAATTVFKVAA